ncbi:leukemia NUP98 fusion partner 1 isoform X1 [Haliaeetus albicilla]|uniref:leukemia NUP98 fusion partner 1 isoform X1 n=1 Tax=Haliaeetus albicilla TaxID=8969 RepID=UPI0037E861C5
MRMRKRVEATRNVRHDPLVKGEPPFRLSTAQGRILGAGDQGAFAKEAPDVGTRPLLGQGQEQARLSSLHTARLHASTKGSSSGHLKGSKEFQEDQDVKCHCHRKASRTPSADSSCPETRSNSIQEFAESFEKQLHLKSKRSVSLQPEGMKERRERERLHLRKSKSHKRMGEKSEPRREQEEDEGSEVVPAKHNEQFPSQASIEKGYLCTGS